MSAAIRAEASIKAARFVLFATHGFLGGEYLPPVETPVEPGANVVETVARIKALIPQFEAQLPPTVRFTIASDRTITTNASLHDAQRNMIVSIVLVVIVVFVTVGGHLARLCRR